MPFRLEVGIRSGIDCVPTEVQPAERTKEAVIIGDPCSESESVKHCSNGMALEMNSLSGAKVRVLIAIFVSMNCRTNGA